MLIARFCVDGQQYELDIDRDDTLARKMQVSLYWSHSWSDYGESQFERVVLRSDAVERMTKDQIVGVADVMRQAAKNHADSQNGFLGAACIAKVIQRELVSAGVTMIGGEAA